MADTPTAIQDATRLAALIRQDPDRLDPATAAEAGVELLTALGTGTDVEAMRLVAHLVGFAVRAAPHHPSAPQWWDALGFAHGRLAEETDSTAEYGVAIACSLTAVSSPQAPPAVAERAAVEAAHLTGSLLYLGIEEQTVTAGRARQLTEALDAISLSWDDAVNATHFAVERARALRWSHPLTGDVTDLERAATLLRRVLAEPVAEEGGEDRVNAWELLSIVLAELYALGGDLDLLAEALAAAVEVCELLPEDHEWLPEAHGSAAAMAAEVFWNSDGETGAVLNTALTSFAAKRAAVGLNDEEAVFYALLLQARGCGPEDVPALTAAVEVLATPERAPGAEVALAGLYEMLIHLEDPRHAWDALDWATRALSRTDLDPGVVVPLHGSRLIGLAAALEAFGGEAVAARCDVDAVLAGARIEALADEDVARAELGLRAAQLRGRWAADRFPVDIDLFAATSAEVADAMLRMRDHADGERGPKLAAAASVLRDMVPVITGDRDPGPLRAALRDESLRDLVDVAGLLRLVEQRSALKALVDSGQPVGVQLRELLADLGAEAGDSGRGSGVGALAPLMSALVETVDVVETGDSSARADAYRKGIRMCDDLPDDMASSPFVRSIRGFLAAQLAVGGHDPDQAGPAIEDLERALDRPGGRADPQIAQRLGLLLRGRGGPGDAERSREVGLRALVRQVWDVLTHPDRAHDPTASSLVREVGDWCGEDGAHDDLVRVVEAERGVALARGAGVELLRAHLVDTGRAALAEEWAAARGAGGSWAGRRLAPGAFLSEEDRRALAEPLGPEEIRPLLRDRGLDALVYLVPGRPTAGGVVVVVPVEGAVTSARLPLLTGEWFTRNPTADPAALDAFGGWAWLAGGAAVLAAAQAAAPGRVPRVALAPAGVLGSVPWAAAWRETGTGRRHLVEDVEITLVPSARLLARTPRADAEPVLLTGCPDRMPGPDYDEALEPSSTFLVEGARAVVRGVWPVADSSALFSLVRHHLRENPANPAAALREAQLRMLRSPRVLPAGGREDPTGIACWGGFAHLGA
ncbi:CHAT domain-containing protein [Actinokineospora sp. PR83]|uniref:CHAT domain-containing protein n=1 Tax=Actinokineospora sp. PR83 TaxID=2884908 RepID=UPI0027E2052C|nr:CHAT domain-containing protein [Actinokineospora sp. PR83]